MRLWLSAREAGGGVKCHSPNVKLAGLCDGSILEWPRARVEVTGIYRATPVRVNPRNRAVHQLYRTYIDVVHIRMTDSKRVRVNRKDVGPSEYSAKYDAGASDPI